MESGIIQLWLAIKWLVTIYIVAWLGKRYMDFKQQTIFSLYFIYCFVNGYAVAATILPDPVNGLSPEAFILGLMGAVCACAWLQKIDNSPKTYGALILSMLLAGCCSIGASKIFIHWCNCLDMNSLQYAMPLIIGVAVPTLIPVGLSFITNTWGKGKENA
jgi:FtsH-binding integral membrane protein